MLKVQQLKTDQLKVNPKNPRVIKGEAFKRLCASLKEDPEYLEARRLTGFLRHFRLAPPDQVPSTSILREFIG